MAQVISRDGTVIGYERSGSGPALILVDGAFCSRSFGPMPKLAPLLAPHFTVYMYDRRGRGESGDTQPYEKEREVEDLAALIQAAGGSAHLLGLSSGAALALEAAASGLKIEKVVAYEPPFTDEGGNHAGADHLGKLKSLVSGGNRGGAVKYFMRDMVGMPGIVVAIMRVMRKMWRQLEAVAHTLPYDAAIMNRFEVPTRRLGAVQVPTLVMHGGKTTRPLQNAARQVAEAVPGAMHRTLAGQTHNVKGEVLAPAVVEFCKG